MSKKFRVPDGFTEEQVLESIAKAVAILAPSFVFGYMDLDDVKQEATMMGLRGMAKYDPTRPLDNFVYTHIRNRLINYKRDHLRRNDPPCRECHDGYPCADGSICRKYSAWLSRNNAKANLMRPQDIERVPDENERRARSESTADFDVETAELLEKIDLYLPVELRASYLQMRDGLSVPAPRRREVEAAVRAIIGEDLS